MEFEIISKIVAVVPELAVALVMLGFVWKWDKRQQCFIAKQNTYFVTEFRKMHDENMTEKKKSAAQIDKNTKMLAKATACMIMVDSIKNHNEASAEDIVDRLEKMVQ